MKVYSIEEEFLPTPFKASWRFISFIRYNLFQSTNCGIDQVVKYRHLSVKTRYKNDSMNRIFFSHKNRVFYCFVIMKGLTSRAVVLFGNSNKTFEVE